MYKQTRYGYRLGLGSTVGCPDESLVHEITVTECAHSCVALRFGLRQTGSEASAPQHMRADPEGAQREPAPWAATPFCDILSVPVRAVSDSTADAWALVGSAVVLTV